MAFPSHTSRSQTTVKLPTAKPMVSINIDGANYDLALWVAYYNFLRPHQHNNYKVLNEVEMLSHSDTMPGKWQMVTTI